MELITTSAHCIADFANALPISFWAIFGTLFVLGFMGSLTHCTFMCGPFVMAQMSAKMEYIDVNDMSELSRLRSSLLMPYHMGRLTTYVILGGIVAIITQGTSLYWSSITDWLLLTAGILMILSVIPTVWQKMPFFGGNATHMLTNKLSKKIKPFLNSPYNYKGYILGFILGFLPCGMLYAALGAAASTANIWHGMLAMAGFALGTIPVLILTAQLGTLALKRFKTKTGIITKGAKLIAGFWLCFIALSSI